MSRIVELAAIVLLIVGAVLSRFTSPVNLDFDDSASLCDLVSRRGYYLDRERRPEEPQFSFCFSDHPFTDEMPLELSRCDRCGLTPEWNGIVRVYQIQSSIGVLAADTIGGKTRRWGNVLLAGDEKLMDRIEKLIRAERGADRRFRGPCR
jgi:hypothetical protein